MKKIVFTIILLLISCLTAYAAPIHTYKEDIPISDTVTLTKVSEFHSGHNISYSYIKADLSDKDTRLKLLKSNSGTDVLETMDTLASTDPQTVAALNADFFSVFKGNQGFALGVEINNGNLSQSPINPDTMATIFSDDNGVTMGYIKFLVAVVAPNGEFSTILHINKPTTYYGNVLMYTSEFNGGMSPAPGGVVVEVVVEDGVIKEFRRNMPPAKIPENGCVLVVSEGSSMFFANNFNVGDPVKFDYYVTPDLSEIQTAFGGGGMLVSDGKALTSFSHVISGYNPRSAIGVDKSGKTLYLVAVDGRQSSSRGMSMSELAKLMESLGCYQAVNLDGGGSTRMVASTLQNPRMHAVNSPTENRKVINGVGITYSKKPDKPKGIRIEASTDTVFVGQPVSLSARVYDQNMRPIEGSVTYSSDYGKIENGIFTPHRGGKATVKADFGNIHGETEIFVVNKVAGIDVPSHLSLKTNTSSQFDLNVFDSDGHYVNVTDFSTFVITSSNPSVVSVSGNTLKAHKNGTAIISVKRDGVVSHISVAAGSQRLSYTDNFELVSGTFKSYPETVPGSFELTSEQAYDGNSSGKLSFDFTGEDDVTKGAYFTLNQRIQVHDEAENIEVSMYTDVPLEHQIRAQFIDANGKIAIASFGKDFEDGKWNKLTAEIPKDAALPLTLDRIYVLYVAGEPKDRGCVYLDNLTFDTVAPLKYAATPDNVYAVPTTTAKAQFTVGALQKDTSTLFSQLTNMNVEKYLANKNALTIGKNNVFSSYADANALYIRLNTEKGGIRATDSTQWDKMSALIKDSQHKNLFIVANDSIFGTSDYENQVIRDYLADLDKQVFVICGGTANTYKNINGVNYFTLNCGFGETTDLARIQSCKALEFNFGTKTTFTWKNIY